MASQENQPLPEKIATAMAAKEAAELAAANIEKYLLLHETLAGARVMAIHESTLADVQKMSRVAAEVAERNLREFLRQESD